MDGDLDYIGEDEMIGEATRGGRMMQQVRPSGGIRGLRNVSMQGVSLPQEELDVLPFDVTQIVTGGPTSSSAVGLPQRPFQGQRLIGTAFLTSGGTTIDAGGLVSISPALYVGAVQVGASQGSLPLSMFGPTAVGVRLGMPSAGQGTRIYIPFVYGGPALGAGDTLLVLFSLIGRAVR